MLGQPDPAPLRCAPMTSSSLSCQEPALKPLTGLWLFFFYFFYLSRVDTGAEESTWGKAAPPCPDTSPAALVWYLLV